MVRGDGYVNVMDFGLAKWLPGTPGDHAKSPASDGLSRTGQIVGTLAYMSEQITGDDVDSRSDPFAFGIILYEMLTGCHPWGRPTAVATMYAIVNDDPPAMESAVVGPQLAAVGHASARSHLTPAPLMTEPTVATDGRERYGRRSCGCPWRPQLNADPSDRRIPAKPPAMINRAFLGRSSVLVAIWLLCHTSPAVAQTSIGVLRVTLPLVTATDDTSARLAQRVLRDVAIMRLRAVDSVLSPILPNGTRFDVSVEACGRPDYLYDRSRRRVVLCTEMDGFARAVVRAALRRERVAVPGLHDDERDDVLNGFAIFAILHELGHAAIDMFQLPVPGSGEDAADGFAAYVLLARGESGTVRGAAQWLAWLESHLVSTSVDRPQDHADGHALPGQRYQRLRCLLDGRMPIPPDASESDNRPDCQGGWLRLSDAWQQLLRARSAP